MRGTPLRRGLWLLGAFAIIAIAVPTVGKAGPYPSEDVQSRFEYSCDKTGDPLIDGNPQELFGVKGPCVTEAWNTTTGRHDVAIAVLDSGINWPDPLPDLRRKVRLNKGELPKPQGSTNYDADGNGLFNIDDYADDPNAVNRNGNEVLDPEDLIMNGYFSNGVDNDNNGYVDDIAGWDFWEDDNNPRDEPHYGHGTGEAHDSSGEANNGGDVGLCPECMFVPLRVGDSFIADVNHFAEAVVYATDNGVRVVQEALGTLNNSRFGQEAIDYAWRRGVVVVASAADEAAAHHNYPANYNHTMVVNSIRTADLPTRQPQSYLYLNGCTNFGGHTHVTVPGESCSSEATGRAAGMAGLVYSAALNERDKGDLTSELSADEVRQIFRAAADDINFSDPALPTADPPFPGAPPNNYAVVDAVPTERYHSVRGWDQFFGYGRVNAQKMVELIDATSAERSTIPPEADITGPSWFQIFGTDQTIDVTGSVAARRASSYTYRLEWAAGVQPPEWPGDDVWHTVTSSSSLTKPFDGQLGRIDTNAVKAAIDSHEGWQATALSDPTSKSFPEKNAFRVRVRVTDNFGNVGEDQRQFFVQDDPDLLPGFPKQIGSDGASSPVFADIDDDGKQELVFGSSNGEVHALRHDGSEAAGWPVQVDPAPVNDHSNAAGLKSGEMTMPVRAAILGAAPTVADLDRDGDVEILAADLEGKVYAWEHDGKRRKNFPVSVDRRYSQEAFESEIRDRYNRRDWGVNASPTVGDLDGNDGGQLELVFGANDTHVYAFNHDGSPVPGWPVLVRDPSKVAKVDPRTHKLTFRGDSGHAIGTKILPNPSMGDIDDDGDVEVLVGVNEEYVETPNFSFNNLSLAPINASGLVEQGNGRVYALDHRGTLTPQSEDRYPEFPDEQAYMPGWPFKPAMLTTDLLPYVGTGVNGPPALADVDGNGDLEIGTFSFAGPGYILGHDGVSIWGRDPAGNDIGLNSERPFYGALSNGIDTPALPALGAGIFTRMGPTDDIAFVAPGGGLIRILDVLLSGHQLAAQDYVLAWDLSVPGGTFLPGFPHEVNDLQFLTAPGSAEITGDDLPELVGGSSVSDVFAPNVLGLEPSGWPKFTGGWTVAVPTVGDFDEDGSRDVAGITREGWVFVWKTEGNACGPADWPKAGHDLWNTGNFHTDATRPGVITDLKRSGSLLSWTAPGDDERCGTAERYEIRVSKKPIRTHADWLAATPVQEAPKPAAAGAKQSARVVWGEKHAAVRSVDEAGNWSAISR
jgi:hypothetical protein